jgi:hypothetical protein
MIKSSILAYTLGVCPQDNLFLGECVPTKYIYYSHTTLLLGSMLLGINVLVVVYFAIKFFRQKTVPKRIKLWLMLSLTGAVVAPLITTLIVHHFIRSYPLAVF